MKKLLRGIVLALIPLVLYYGLFLAFEPNNFFGLRAKTPTGAVFGVLRQYQKAPTEGVLLGDSRFANMGPLDGLNDQADITYSNLAFGGASLTESLDELEWLLDNYGGTVKEVVFEYTFYTMNAGYSADRFDFIEMALYNPFAYLTNLSYNLEAMQNLVWWLQGETLGGGEAETRDPATYEWAEWQSPAGESVTLRQDVAAYLDRVTPVLAGWQPNNEAFDRLLALIDRCEAAGIGVTVVMPPVHDALFAHLVQAGGIYDAMLPYLARLEASPARLLDYELTARPAYAEEDYFDGLHLDYQRGLPKWKETLFEELTQDHGA